MSLKDFQKYLNCKKRLYKKYKGDVSENMKLVKKKKKYKFKEIFLFDLSYQKLKELFKFSRFHDDNKNTNKKFLDIIL